MSLQEGGSSYVIWTVNIDRKKSRSEGRRIPRRLAVPNVKLDELAKACEALGLSYEIEQKKYPRCWWEEGGRVRVEKKMKKSELMVKLAEKIREMRG
ncbi:Signal recognition particle 19 kDa protein [Geoglobus ahangari]|uniref:Signal recognition particle 19 kDa protein n=1 Tax=Geoglobus ahangari TaxID=113653 RepID=A0A0F7IHY7_9EURY|nr:signal recognition particle subunit SRP19/SEC65 family protein [Geoglobus ahangari]AKG92623.1 Signal recognition particle 19 kDa protein [Geoglobus ahangari]NOY10728.1 signal recognition particle protein Srp19 [Archaeoglobi archaeon]